MSSQSVTEAERLRVSLARDGQRLASAERLAELLVGGSFLVGAVALALLGTGQRSTSLALAAMYVLAVAGASRARFDIGGVFAWPMQLVFVAMLFALPVDVVPLLVALGTAVGTLPSIVRERVSPTRLLLAPGNCWFALGPAAVLTLAHDGSPDGRFGVLALALLAELICDALANSARERISPSAGVAGLIGELPRVYLIDLALSPVGLAIAFATESHAWAVLLVAPLMGLLTVFSRERRVRLEQLIELNDAYRGTALLLGDVVEADDGYTGAHCRDVVELAVKVAEHLGLDADRRRHVEFAALLHDVGKITVPKEIINKPGKLDEAEWAIIRTHTIEGQRMLERVGGFMREVGSIVRSSHERWDGGGYPDGLRGEDIPLEARIVCACDAFNAMTTSRSYRAAMPVDQALAELIRCAGTQFDPRAVEALVAVAATVPPPAAPEPVSTPPALAAA